MPFDEQEWRLRIQREADRLAERRRRLAGEAPRHMDPQVVQEAVEAVNPQPRDILREMQLNWAKPVMPPLRRGAQVRIENVPAPAQMVNPPDWEADDDDEDNNDGNGLGEVAMPQGNGKKIEPVTFEKSTRLPRFKMKYDNYEEARLRLSGTVITVNDRPVLVSDVGRRRDGGRNSISILVRTWDGIVDDILLGEPGLNLRSFEPGYIELKGMAWYLHRVPARVYKQGLNSENSRIKLCGSTTLHNAFAHGVEDLLKALEDRPVVEYTSEMGKELLASRLRNRSTRLCDALAVYAKNGNLFVEYKGRDLGRLKGNTVILDASEDRMCSWIVADCQRVGLNVE